MLDLEMKKKVAQEIMDLMDQKDGERLKSKSPKFMAATIEVEKKPKLEEEEKAESPMMEKSEDKAHEMGEGEMTPEMIQKLLEMLGEKE